MILRHCSKLCFIDFDETFLKESEPLRIAWIHSGNPGYSLELTTKIVSLKDSFEMRVMSPIHCPSFRLTTSNSKLNAFEVFSRNELMIVLD